MNGVTAGHETAPQAPEGPGEQAPLVQGPREQGLRERGKARRREAIVRAGYRLFAERGYDATTVSDIAAEAEVSPRTVAMYFPSKQDIALSRFSEGAGSLTTLLRERAREASVTSVLDKWLHDDRLHPDDDIKRLGQQMFAANPELNALRWVRMADAVNEGAKIIAEQARLAPGDPGARIAAVATAAVLIELSDLPRGPEREEAIATALTFLDVGTRTLYDLPG